MKKLHLPKQLLILILILLIIIGCKKEKLNLTLSIQEFEEQEESTTLFPSDKFENIIFKSDLRGLKTLSNLPDELYTEGGETFNNEGILLKASSIFRMKYPSTLDRSQLIIDVSFTPIVKYIDENTKKEVSLKEITTHSTPFSASIENTNIFVGKSLLSIGGTVFGFKIMNKTLFLELYKITSGTTSSSIDNSETTTSTSIPLDEFFGDVKKNYWKKFNLRFTLTKDVNLNHLIVKNLQTGKTISCQGKSKNQSNGCQWGYGFIRTEQLNTINVQQFIYRSLDKLSSKVLFLGHSFIEGNSLANTPEGFNARYASIIKTSLNGNAIIAGMGGANTANLLSRIKMDLDPFSPKYVVIDCISNENSSSTWHYNTLALIKKIEEKNAIPILLTAPPRLGYEAIITTANDLIRSSMGYKFIDLNDIVSSNQSPSIWKNGYSMPDGVHPTVMAHQKISERFYIDIPEMFID